MVQEIFAGLPGSFQPGNVEKSVSYYFTLGETKKTVQINPTECRVEDGKTIENADCVCKTSEEFFVKIWEEGYRPGLKDFMSGTIKSNAPDELKTFLKAFGKEA